MAISLVTRGLARLRSLLAVTWGLGRSGPNAPAVEYGFFAADAVSMTPMTCQASMRSITDASSLRVHTDETSLEPATEAPSLRAYSTSRTAT